VATLVSRDANEAIVMLMEENVFSGSLESDCAFLFDTILAPVAVVFTFNSVLK